MHITGSVTDPMIYPLPTLTSHTNPSICAAREELSLSANSELGF